MQNRREFLRAAGLVGAGAAAIGLAACASPKAPTPAAPAAPASAAPASGSGTGHQTAAPSGSSAPMTAEQMDKMHEEGVKKFPAKTEGKGAQLLQPRMEGDVKVYELTCKVVQWEVEPGKKVEAWTYNGTVPGPMIRVTEGDKVKIIVKNELPESTAVHWHGQPVPNAMDGVPYITQKPIKPGETFTYEFVVKQPGTHMYHTHHNSTAQIMKGLAGPFIVEPKDKSKEPKYDQDVVLSLGDGGTLGYNINGKGFPATEPIVAKLGQRVRVRFMNEGLQIHPMHIHGLVMDVFERDGFKLPAPFKCDTLMIAPGERWDAIITADNPGVWAFHCHVLSHAEAEEGMFGMVTAFIVEK